MHHDNTISAVLTWLYRFYHNKEGGKTLHSTSSDDISAAVTERSIHRFLVYTKQFYLECKIKESLMAGEIMSSKF